MRIVAQTRRLSGDNRPGIQCGLDESRRSKSPYDSIPQGDTVSTAAKSRFQNCGLSLLVPVDVPGKAGATFHREAVSSEARESENPAAGHQSRIALALFPGARNAGPIAPAFRNNSFRPV